MSITGLATRQSAPYVGGVVQQPCVPGCAEQNEGYYKLVDELRGPCAFQRCSRSASVTLKLLVEGDESVLVTCDRHADWVRAYVAEDAAVQVTADVPGLPGERSTPGDMADLA